MRRRKTGGNCCKDTECIRHSPERRRGSHDAVGGGRGKESPDTKDKQAMTIHQAGGERKGHLTCHVNRRGGSSGVDG